MRKFEFLAQLRQGLSGLPKSDIEECLLFYSEMIDDRIEDGLSEEEAVLMAGPIDEIVEHTVAEIPLTRIAKERMKPNRRLKTWEIALLVLGSPVWLSLGIAAVAVVLAAYLVLLEVVVFLWAIFATFILSSLASVVAGVIFALDGSFLTGIAIIGLGLVCAGASILMFYGSKMATKGIWELSKRIFIGIKRCFIKKEVA